MTNKTCLNCGYHGLPTVFICHTNCPECGYNWTSCEHFYYKGFFYSVSRTEYNPHMRKGIESYLCVAVYIPVDNILHSVYDVYMEQPNFHPPVTKYMFKFDKYGNFYIGWNYGHEWHTGSDRCDTVRNDAQKLIDYLIEYMEETER